MQYALMPVNEETMVLVDASEYQVLMDYVDNKTQVKILDLSDDVTDLKLVYGTLMPQHEQKIEDVIKKAKDSIGYALASIDERTNECTLIELVDFELYEEHKDRLNYIPFAALIRTDLSIPNLKQRAITSFLRYGNMDILDNVFNRFGIFSIKDQERRIKEEVTSENWKSFIDLERAIRVSKVYK
ncbi:hypothetical protein [Bacillus cereus group sp. BfR-BA-01329]|uniref:hypothetical protein n=1 Tax=Bacillus cereus group sp. BfR-BA-01329 TaxID=2920305 RepID=UPI001F57202B|nr:hypothetical protein [Bacillus cereus group sp. BfR-BA-01329]